MLSPTTWTELSPRDCGDLLRSCASGRFLYTDRALPAVQPTSFQLDGSRLLFLAPPRFKIARAQVFSFHFQADDGAWSVMAHGPVDLQDRTPPRASGGAGAERPRSLTVAPNEPLALDIQLLVGHRLRRHPDTPGCTGGPAGLSGGQEATYSPHLTTSSNSQGAQHRTAGARTPPNGDGQ